MWPGFSVGVWLAAAPLVAVAQDVPLPIQVADVRSAIADHETIGSKRQGAAVLGSYEKTGLHDPDWFINLLNGTKLLVGQNIKFDILWAIPTGRSKNRSTIRR